MSNLPPTFNHLHSALLLVLLDILGQLDKLWQALNEASLGVKDYLSLELVDPVLERHHLADRCLKVRVRTGHIAMIVDNGLLTRR